MKKTLLVIVVLPLLFTINVLGQETNQKSVAVTVYNNNLGVVKDIREINLKNGTSTISISDVAKLIDPTSVNIKLNGEVIEQNYQYDLVNLPKILSKYVDKHIRLFDNKNEMIEGKLLSTMGGQIVLEKSDGGLLMIPNFNEYRISVESLPEGLITKPTLVWQVNSTQSGKQEAQISYQTGGMNWHAEYVAVLNSNDTRLDLKSWVSIDNNSGTTFKNAKLKLVAGDVNLVQAPQPYLRKGQEDMVNAMGVSQPQFEEKEFFEYHIYNLQRPTTLAESETKQISLFESSNIKANKKYYFNSGSYYYRNPSSHGKVAVIIEFENKENEGMGVPMPKGKVRVYKSDGETVEFVGEDLIDHTPRNEKVKLKIGDAFDVLAEEKQIEHKRITDRIYEQSFEIKIKNRKKEDITVEVEKYLGYNWEVLESSLKYEKKDAFNIIYNVPVKNDDETTLKLKIRYIN